MSDGSQMYRNEDFVIYINESPLCYTPETNIILYARCNLKIKINEKKKESKTTSLEQYIRFQGIFQDNILEEP